MIDRHLANRPAVLPESREQRKRRLRIVPGLGLAPAVAAVREHPAVVGLVAATFALIIGLVAVLPEDGRDGEGSIALPPGQSQGPEKNRQDGNGRRGADGPPVPGAGDGMLEPALGAAAFALAEPFEPADEASPQPAEGGPPEVEAPPPADRPAPPSPDEPPPGLAPPDGPDEGPPPCEVLVVHARALSLPPVRVCA